MLLLITSAIHVVRWRVQVRSRVAGRVRWRITGLGALRMERVSIRSSTGIISKVEGCSHMAHRCRGCCACEWQHVLLRRAAEGCDRLGHVSWHSRWNGVPHGWCGRGGCRSGLRGSAWDSALVWTTLDTLFAHLAGRIDACVCQTILDASCAWSSFITLFASLLTVD